MFEFDPNGRYSMPAHFAMPQFEGVPSLWYHDQLAMAVSFVTDRDRLAAHLPKPFEVAEEAIVTVSYARNPKVDWLAGRGYNMITVNAAVVPGHCLELLDALLHVDRDAIGAGTIDEKS